MKATTTIKAGDRVTFTYNDKPRAGIVKMFEAYYGKLADKRSEPYMVVDLDDGKTKNFSIAKVSDLTLVR